MSGTDRAIKAALNAAAQSWCCGLAACHYNDCGLPCEARDHRRIASAVAAFLRALCEADTVTIELNGSSIYVGGLERLAAEVEAAAEGGAGDSTRA